jgi:DNA-binding NarL/FixJ family response regulator
MIRVLIVDDHPLIREGLLKVFSLYPDIAVVGEAASGREALALARELKPDVVLMDLSLPDMNGLEVLEALRDDGAVRPLVLTVHDDDEHVFAAVRAGVAGYLLKDVGPDELVQAVRAVAAGEAVMHPRVARKVMREFSRLSSESRVPGVPLTARELEILRLVARGYSNREIAEKLYISQKTVKNHLTNILRKLGLQDRTQAAVWAVKSRLI